jgi:hypothetical protein
VATLNCARDGRAMREHYIIEAAELYGVPTRGDRSIGARGGRDFKV